MLSWLVAGVVAYGGFVKCTTEDGVIYQDAPCPAGATSESLAIDVQPAKAPQARLDALNEAYRASRARVEAMRPPSRPDETSVPPDQDDEARRAREDAALIKLCRERRDTFCDESPEEIALRYRLRETGYPVYFRPRYRRAERYQPPNPWAWPPLGRHEPPASSPPWKARRANRPDS